MPSESIIGVTAVRRPIAVGTPVGPVERRRVGGYVCHLAFDLSDGEVRSLVRCIAKHTVLREAATGVLGGRAKTWLHAIPSVGPVVVKEYRRGGLLQHLGWRHYLRAGITRPEREFRILRLARSAGVSVPEPVACASLGLLVYRGWLATRRIDGTRLTILAPTIDGEIGTVMARITREVRRLIAHRIAHADLHPGNVIVDGRGTPFLLDFDKATVFDGALDELREHYRVRWTRAVNKYGLPDEFAARFGEGLQDPHP